MCRRCRGKSSTSHKRRRRRIILGREGDSKYLPRISAVVDVLAETRGTYSKLEVDGGGGGDDYDSVV